MEKHDVQGSSNIFFQKLKNPVSKESLQWRYRRPNGL